MELLSLIFLVPVLLMAAALDLRHLRIPNSLSLIAIALCLLTFSALPLPEIGARISGAAIVFACGFLLFMARAFGGGDVKLLSVLVLAIPSHSWLLFAQVFSVSMLVGVTLVVVLRAYQAAPASGLTSIATPRAFPMGISIAMAGVGHLGLLAWF